MPDTTRRGFLGSVLGAIAALAIPRLTYANKLARVPLSLMPTLPAHSADSCYTLSFFYKKPGDTAWQYYSGSLTKEEGVSFLSASANGSQLNKILERLNHTVDDFSGIGAGNPHEDKLALNYLSMNPKAFVGSRLAEGVSVSAEELADRSFLLCGTSLTENFPEALTEEGGTVRATTNYAVPTPPPNFKNPDFLYLRPGCWLSTPNIPPPVYAEFKEVEGTSWMPTHDKQEEANGKV